MAQGGPGRSGVRAACAAGVGLLARAGWLAGAAVLVGLAASPATTAPAVPRRADGAAGLLDVLRFGDAADEAAHGLAAERSEVRSGGLGQPCRVLLPTDPPSDAGGSVTFTVTCDPQRPTYLTVRLWGDDVGETVLYLFHDGRQLGSRQSDWPPLDELNWREKEPRFPGRFFYSTYLLPRGLTQGRTQVTLRIASKGRVYSYAPTYERAQYEQTAPSQGLYAAYTHTDSFFRPPADEPQGRAPPPGPPAPAGPLPPYEYAMEETQRLIDGALRRSLPGPRDTLGIALAYGAAWSRQHKDAAVLDRILKAVDAHVLKGDLKALGWFGPGELAEAVWRVYDDARRAGRFGERIGDPGRPRAEVYAEFFRRAIDAQTAPAGRGGLTNQDIYIITSVVRSNLLLGRLAPTRALARPAMMEFVYQAMGLRPYKGRHEPGQGVKESTSYRFIIGGPIFLSDDWDYFWVTPKGSSKEHGYVPHYGELAWQTATLADLTGDAKVRAQAVRMIAARTPFRVPSNDAEGHAALRIESVIGWRHCWYAGRVEYGDDYLKAAAVLGDPVSVRLAQLFLEHGRIYRGLPGQASLPLLVERVENIRKVQASPPSALRLPMGDDQPDFAWADEGLRAVAFKHRGRRCWMALGWRGAGINNLARVHFTEAAIDRIAHIGIATEFTPSGRTIVRPKDRSGVFVEPGAALVTDGEVLPLAAGPLGGMGDFYVARYGPYLVGMNCAAGKTFTLDVPPQAAGGALADLVSGRTLPPAARHAVPPGTTVILYLGEPDDAAGPGH